MAHKAPEGLAWFASLLSPLSPTLLQPHRPSYLSRSYTGCLARLPLHLECSLLLKKKSEVKVLVAQSCDPMDCSQLGFSVREILQVRILESVAIPFLRES